MAWYLIVILIILNLISFFVMAIDKKRSVGHSKRIPEGTMMFLGILFGAIGIIIGMLTFRHKTKKWYFVCGMPLLLLENISLIILIIFFLEGKILISWP